MTWTEIARHILSKGTLKGIPTETLKDMIAELEAITNQETQ